MSVANRFSVPLYLNHGNDTVPETIVTLKFQGLLAIPQNKTKTANYRNTSIPSGNAMSYRNRYSVC